MNLSYWERDTFLKRSDFAIIGGGIVGLNAALRLKELHPSASVRIYERSALPSGASTKNAGFACFGSVSELEEDLKNLGEERTIGLVRERFLGLQSLIQLHGTKGLEYTKSPGVEVFFSHQQKDKYLNSVGEWNNRLKDVIGPNVYSVKDNESFEGFASESIQNQYEGLIHPGKMILNLFEMCHKAGVEILNGFQIEHYKNTGSGIEIIGDSWESQAGYLLLATNAFSDAFLPSHEIIPARNIVLVTSELDNLQINGGFHLDRGYFYFRNLHKRVLIGGGRHLSPETEQTKEFGVHPDVRQNLVEILQKNVLPNREFRVDYEWSGILGIGNNREVLLQSIDDRIAAGVRLGGMGIAIGTRVGRKLAELFH